MLRQLEVSGFQDDGKNFRLEYWVDENTSLPLGFQLFAKDDSGAQKMVANITCEFNQDYPTPCSSPAAPTSPEVRRYGVMALRR